MRLRLLLPALAFAALIFGTAAVAILTVSMIFGGARHDPPLVARGVPGLPAPDPEAVPEPDQLTFLNVNAAAAGDVLTFEVFNEPGWVHSSDSAASNYQVVWAYPSSPTTPYRSPDLCRCQARYMLLDPRQRDADGRAGRDEWWMVIERNWPASYQANNHGKWGRETNFHNVAGDAGPAGSGGVGWGFGSGVSALALDWNNNEPSPSFCVLCAYGSEGGARYLMPSVTRDAWHTYVVHFVAGRTDGTTVRPGAITIWVDGNDTPALNKTGINTVQRARAADGAFYVQRWMVLWEGDYTSALPVEARLKMSLTRMGATLNDALADRPALRAATTDGDNYTRVSGTAPRPALNQLASRPADAASIPPSLGGGPVTPADALPLTVTSQTSTTVSFKWTAPAGAAGYAFTVDGARVSHTLDPTKTTVTFGKLTGSHVYAVRSLLTGPLGDETATR